MMRTIPATAAGRFYPADAHELRRRIQAYLKSSPTPSPAGAPVAIIAPHAGYDYAGQIAGAAYASLAASSREAGRVLLMGTWHERGARGVAATEADAFETPLGQVAIDRTAIPTAIELLGDHVAINERAHAVDHALQVQLPFLQFVFGSVTVTPLLVGAIAARDVARLVVQLGAAAGRLVVVSSDLSHFMTTPPLAALTRRRPLQL